jgi:hypothetical protein
MDIKKIKIIQLISVIPNLIKKLEQVIQLFSAIFLFFGFSLFAMDDPAARQVMQRKCEQEISYSTIISLIDAYISQRMHCGESGKVSFFDYKNPTVFYLLPINKINRVIYEISKNFRMGMGISAEDKAYEKYLLDKYLNDPVNFTEEEATNIQGVRANIFLFGQDLKEFNEQTRDFIMANRVAYVAAWRTENPKYIQNAMNYQLFSDERPYMSLSKKISTFEQRALN